MEPQKFMDKPEMPINILEIMQQLPHRYPFLLVDRVLDVETGKKITGLKKSGIYKLTAKNEIPVSHFGSRLVFSRSELLTWVNSNTIKTECTEIAISKQIQLAARKKLK